MFIHLINLPLLLPHHIVGNTAGALAGILGPIIVSAFLTTWPGREGWQAAFWLTFAFSGAAMIVWMLFIKAEIVPVLNNPRLYT